MKLHTGSSHGCGDGVGVASAAAARVDAPVVVTDELVRHHWARLHALWSGQLAVGRMRREARETSQRQARPPAPPPPLVVQGQGVPPDLAPLLATLAGRAFAAPESGAAGGEVAPGLALANFFMRSVMGRQQHLASDLQHRTLQSTVAVAAGAAPPPGIRGVRVPGAVAGRGARSGAASGISLDFLDSLGGAFPPRAQGASRYMSRELLGGRVSRDDSLAELLNRSLYDYQPHHQGGGGSTLVALTAAAALSRANSGADGSVPRCPICLDDLQVPAGDREPPKDWATFPCCKQPVHLACGQRALDDNAHCPMCRALVP